MKISRDNYFIYRDRGELCMIYANDDIFNVGYNSELDRLEVKKRKITNKIMTTLKRNKIMTTLIILFATFSFMNCMLIYTFMQMLKNI